MTKNRNYNTDVINAIKEQFGYTEDYIRKCLRGDRKGIMPDKVVASYKKLDKATKEAVKENLH